MPPKVWSVALPFGLTQKALVHSQDSEWSAAFSIVVDPEPGFGRDRLILLLIHRFSRHFVAMTVCILYPLLPFRCPLSLTFYLDLLALYIPIDYSPSDGSLTFYIIIFLRHA